MKTEKNSSDKKDIALHQMCGKTFDKEPIIRKGSFYPFLKTHQKPVGDNLSPTGYSYAIIWKIARHFEVKFHKNTKTLKYCFKNDKIIYIKVAL